MSTINEVASAAGVSKATVSRVLSGTTPVKEETRARILAAIETLGYSPNQAARSLASNKSFTVGVVASSVESGYYGPSVGAIERTLRRFDRHVIIASGYKTLIGEQDAVDFLIKRQVDALVLVTNWLSPEQILEINKRCSVFVMNQHFPGDRGKNISFDNFKGGHLALDYLLGRGYRKIAIVSGPLWKDDANQRHQGCLKALSDKGLVPFWHQEGSFERSDGTRHMEAILALPERPDAVFFANDEMTIAALRVCYQQGVKVPEDMAIMGFDDSELANYYSPSITTIRMPLADMAQATAKLLMKRIYGANLEVKAAFEPTLVVRESA
ncbi:LacI family DNA-binding transcriptional regulator [Marinomonas sp. IMCC 4694]|uniref:LacI family DNA-binding transcriptional regulator n=1 Tax=Marinomonas sp. IMCC 4694 TaxID=2605432 RepID=UPI0011E894BB|nr:LacI family DNA-binding transcriptional regulator [Marinomonas sp. IMCC 4694]TYL46960.1 LacI family transcriptional regulator [Marinomonas sp. IMCC 4694]